MDDGVTGEGLGGNVSGNNWGKHFLKTHPNIFFSIEINLNNHLIAADFFFFFLYLDED